MSTRGPVSGALASVAFALEGARDLVGDGALDVDGELLRRVFESMDALPSAALFLYCHRRLAPAR